MLVIVGDGSADFCLFGKLEIKGKCKTSALRHSRMMEGNLDIKFTEFTQVLCYFQAEVCSSVGKAVCVVK